jgi:hypothetical protein
MKAVISAVSLGEVLCGRLRSGGIAEASLANRAAVNASLASDGTD